MGSCIFQDTKPEIVVSYAIGGEFIQNYIAFTDPESMAVITIVVEQGRYIIIK